MAAQLQRGEHEGFYNLYISGSDYMDGKQAVDITAVRHALQGERDLKQLVNSIWQYEAAQSIVADLRDAKLSVEALIQIEADKEARRKLSGALMTHAVLSYCRATLPGSEGRAHIEMTGNYSVDQKKKHKRIVHLRNNVFAHFGMPSKEHGSGWIEERAIIKIVGDREQPSFVRNRANYLGDVVEDLHELLQVAIDTGIAIREKRVAFMTEEIGKHVDDPRVGRAIKSSPFNPLKFFGAGQMEDFWDYGQNVRGEAFRVRERDKGQPE
ncbi:hypothetical protein [Rhizobium leguminosarum]|uniref:hypothetical protein n=1 Tax=Rhizobium leguminosarum TaxID=384 RepID=UPI00103C1420|nr:hypothetical protein [Rhizobium leguminosarum]TCA53738.1 hypothetical protein E0H41_30810 [Rhizobium leguminosarum bv. viciae]TCB17482.1 hypothetical protein E0J09_31325 [Rhizobium leguminosarum bv. viciae]